MHYLRQGPIEGVCDACGAAAEDHKVPEGISFASAGDRIVTHAYRGGRSLCGQGDDGRLVGHTGLDFVRGFVGCDNCRTILNGKPLKTHNPSEDPQRRDAMLGALQERYGEGVPAACGARMPTLRSVSSHEKRCVDCRRLESERGILPAPTPAPTATSTPAPSEPEVIPMTTTYTAPCGKTFDNGSGLGGHKGKCPECQALKGKKTEQLRTLAKTRAPSKAPELLQCPACKEKVPLLVGRGKGRQRLCPRCTRSAGDEEPRREAKGSGETLAPELAATKPKRGNRPKKTPAPQPTHQEVLATITQELDDLTVDNEVDAMREILAKWRNLSSAGKSYVRGRLG